MKKQYIRPLAKMQAVRAKTDLLDFDLIGGGQSGNIGTNTNGGAKERFDSFDSGLGTGSSEGTSSNFGSDNGPWESLW